MRQSTIDAYTNSQENFNTTHANAWAMAFRASKRTPRNLFPPPIQTVVLMPRVQGYVGEEYFEEEMFHPGQPFAHTPLNHYLLFEEEDGRRYFLNAGFLLDKFAWGDKSGYAALKEAVAHAKHQKPSEDRGTKAAVAEGQSAGVQNP